MAARLQQVLDYWFGANWLNASLTAKQQGKIWWQKSDLVDTEIRQVFAPLLDDEMNDLLTRYRQPEELLARIILTDQMTRNMFRGTPQAFACDQRARVLTRQLTDVEDHLQLPPIAQVFVFMPLEHSELLADQQQAVSRFETLTASVDDAEKSVFSGFLDYARQHLVVIERFGRFPHRNAILGRDSTEAEREFLRQPGSRF